MPCILEHLERIMCDWKSLKVLQTYNDFPKTYVLRYDEKRRFQSRKSSLKTHQDSFSFNF